MYGRAWLPTSQKGPLKCQVGLNLPSGDRPPRTLVPGLSVPLDRPQVLQPRRERRSRPRAASGRRRPWRGWAGAAAAVWTPHGPPTAPPRTPALSSADRVRRESPGPDSPQSFPEQLRPRGSADRLADPGSGLGRPALAETGEGRTGASGFPVWTPPPAALWLGPGPEPRTRSVGDTQAAAGAPGTGGHRPLALMRGPRAAPAAARGASRGISWGTHAAREAAPPPAGTSRSIRLFSTFIITNLMLFFFF